MQTSNKCKEQQPHINNHFSHNLATTKTISSNNGSLAKDFHNPEPQQQPFYNNKSNKLKRLSVLSTTMPKQYTQQHQQQQLQQQEQPQYNQSTKQQHYLTQQYCQQLAILRKSPKPHYSLTLNNKYALTTATTKCAPNLNPKITLEATTTTTKRNSLSHKDLNIYEFSHLEDCDLDPHNDDYYSPSSTEILRIQKSLQHDDDVENEEDSNIASLDVEEKNKNITNDNVAIGVGRTCKEERNSFKENRENAENESVVELENKIVKRLSANLNDLEITKNATNNLLKQQQANRLWYH